MTQARAWAERPAEADYLGNPGFSRLFLAPRQLRPRLIVKGSGIDWLSVSAEWEQEGMKLTSADLQRLATATSRYVKLPDADGLENLQECLAGTDPTNAASALRFVTATYPGTDEARIASDRLVLDMLTVADDETDDLASALRSVLG